MDIKVKRVYETAGPADGRRVLVDRIWPRGLAKDKARLDGWVRDLAPSTELRLWFHHEPARWDEFRRRYFAELEAQRPLLEELRNHAAEGCVTLLFAAADSEHNNAVALKEYLERAPKGQVHETRSAERPSRRRK